MITFKKFLEDSRGSHGEYANDAAEKTMIHTIINVLFGGQKDDANYEKAYSFVESDMFKDTYDKYYLAFQEKSESGKSKKIGDGTVILSPESGRMINEFKNVIRRLYAEWKKST